MTALFFFSQRLSAQCDKLPFAYTINGCTVTFFSTDPTPLSPIYWDFGDGTTGSGDPVTHVYLSNGTYSVTASYTGFSGTYTCTQTFTLTGCNMTCCSAAFSGQVTRDCGALYLSLTSECSNGAHSWSVTTVPAGECFTLVGFNSAMASQTVQLTNINTCTVTRLSITHTVDCAGGPYTVTQSVDINEDAIFIGRKNATTNLQDYNCVLPGASYSGACPVYVSGIVNTDKNFTFTGTDIQMDPGQTGFDVPSGKTLELTQNTYVHGVSGNSCNCLWRGIYVNGGELKFSATSVTSATVEDALYAVRVFESSTLGLKRVIFNKNFVSLRASDGDFIFSSNQQNFYDGTGPLKGICGLAALNDLTVAGYSDSGIPTLTVQYSNNRGYSGWFINNLTAITLPELPFTQQNLFVNLSKGIESYDTDLIMKKNSRFSLIQPGASYMNTGTAGVFFCDTDIDGNNSISLIGNGSGSFLPGSDYDECSIGIFLGTSVLNTQVNITGNSIIGAQTGILIDQRDGTVIGSSTGGVNPMFPGIISNKIRVQPSSFIDLFGSNGIFVRDLNSGLSNLEIARNDIRVNFNQELQSGNGTATGITASGYQGGGIPFSSFQLNIHSNRIELPLGRFGIRMAMYPAAFIHDNGPTGAANAGIFVNWNNTVNNLYSRGIFLTGVRTVNNLVSCNEIISTAQGASSLSIWGAPDNVYVRNHLEGPSIGADFKGMCGTISKFRCNLMEDNIGQGLSYTNLAQTGPQAAPEDPGPPYKPAESSGNEWIGTFTPNEKAFADGTITLINSRYYVRTSTPTENPLPNVNPVNGWFFATVPNGNSANCLYSCPTASPQEPPSKELSYLDFQIASDSAQYDIYPEVQRWWNERHLYEKLYYSPALANNIPIMQAFIEAKAETPMAALVRLSGQIDSLYFVNNEQHNLLLSNNEVISNRFEELVLVDSLLADSLTQTQSLGSLRTQRAGLLNQISVLQAENAAINLAVDAQRLGSVATFLSVLALIAPDNHYEANEKEVLSIYLETVVASEKPDSADLARLFNIGSECIYEGGPAVDLARHLYAGFSGLEIPPADCPIVGNRTKNPGDSMLSSVGSTDILIYPNPASDYLWVRLPIVVTVEDQYTLILENSLGQTILQTPLGSSKNLVPLTRITTGVYKAKVIRGSVAESVQLISIYR